MNIRKALDYNNAQYQDNGILNAVKNLSDCTNTIFGAQRDPSLCSG